VVTIGLTGNVGAGKSMVAGIWKRERGAVVIEADWLGREAVKPGSMALTRLVNRFGREILMPDGSLDRGLMGELAFAKQENLEALNSIVHPEIIKLIRKEIEKAQRESDRAVVIDAALIVELGFENHLDYLVVVDAPKEVRMKRMLAKKKMDQETLERVMEVQIPAQRLKERADYVIENDRDEKWLEEKALEVFDRMMADSK